MQITFKLKYFLLALAVFLIELFIALFVRDAFIRPYGGDILAVIFVYYVLRTFIKTSANVLAIAAFVIALLIELLQYFNFVTFLGIKKGSWLYIVLGASFSWGDILCYAIGFMIIKYVIPNKYK